MTGSRRWATILGVVSMLGVACSGESLVDEDTGGTGGAGTGGGGVSGAGGSGGSSDGGSGGDRPPPMGTGGDAGAGTAGTGATGTAGSGGGSGGGTPRVPQLHEPADGATLLIIGQDTSSIESYLSAVGPMPAGVMMYTSIGDLVGIDGAVDFGAGQQSLGAWTGRAEPFVLQIGVDLMDQNGYRGGIGAVNGGYFDGNIDTLAARLRDSGRPVFLRVGYEFDAETSATDVRSKYDPDGYQLAFRRFANRFRDAGAHNVAFVWHAWAYRSRDPDGSGGGVHPSAWYPGDDFVDWVAVSVFPGWDDDSDRGAAIKMVQMAALATEYGKPLMIAESCPRARYQPSLGQASWDGWYAPVFEYIDQNDVKAFSYINANWEAQGMWQGGGWGDTQVQSNPLVLGLWNQQVSGPRFLHSAASLYSALGFQ